MAEYVLKLDIDESELGRKLKRVLGGMNVGGGGQVTALGGNFTPAQNQKMFEAGFKNLTLQNERIIKQLLKSDETRKKGFLGKFGPQLFKLAGITMGLGALAQIGKMMIDSSPLLQAMAKIGQTAFTLFLRPFGDFISMMLRPFILLMLRYAIKFYRDFGPAFIAAGKIAGEGDILGAAKLIEETAEKSDAFGAGLIQSIAELIRALGGDYEGVLPQAGGLQSPPVSPEQQAENVAKALGDIYPWLQQRPTVDGKPVSGPTMECGEFYCKPPGGATVFEQWKEYLGATSAEFDEAELSAIDMSAQFGKIAEYAVDASKDGESTAKTFKNIARLYVDARRDGISARESIEIIAEQLGMAEQRVLELLSRLSKQKTKKGKKTAAAKEAREIIAEEGGEGIIATCPSTPTPEPEVPRVSQETKDRAAIDAIISYNKAFGWDISKPRPSPYEKIYPNVVADYKSRYPNYRINEYATGGVISEPVLGIGQRTGQTYSIAERGPEQVTPLGCGGGPINVTFNVSGVFNTRDFESSVKPMVLRWFKEVKSNRGII